MLRMYLFSVIQGILKNKPKLLVTHSLQFLSAADNILVLNEVHVDLYIRVNSAVCADKDVYYSKFA